MGENVQVKARIRSADIYSGHADGPELAAWLAAHRTVSGAIFLTHGEAHAIDELRNRLLVADATTRVLAPALDSAFELGRRGPREFGGPPRITPDSAGRLDWHNELSSLILDIDDAVARAADERGRKQIIRRLRKALAQD